jgi:ArsR family transcriptional regulator
MRPFVLMDVYMLHIISNSVNMFLMTDSCAPECCVLESTLDDQQATDLAAQLKALADPVRLRLLSMIATSAAGELCACTLPEALDRSQPTTSHHLSQLVHAGLLVREQRGKWAWFRLDTDRLGAIRAALGEGVDAGTSSERRCCEATASPRS